MTVFYQKRRTGKTVQLIKLSAETNLPIVVWSTHSASYIKRQAREMNLSIPEPIVARHNACVGKQYYVDESLLCLNQLLGGDIVAASVTDE